VLITSGGVKTDDDAGAFIIAMDKIPEASCVSIATTEWGGDAGGGLLAMAIASGATAYEFGGMKTATETAPTGGSVYIVESGDLPVSVVDASSDCKGAENAIAWKYM
jgi:hypothetical protein